MNTIRFRDAAACGMIGASALTVVVVLIGCTPASSGQSQTPAVYVDSYPLSYFAERLGRPETQTYFPVPSGEDPAHWEPADAELRAYQDADLVLLSGAGYATWTDRASLPSNHVVDTSDKIPKEVLVNSPDGMVHSHGDEEEHSHDVLALHSWLDPKLALLQAEAVRDALAERTSVDRGLIDQRFAGLQADLDDLQTRMDALKEKTAGMSLLASHPVYDYLAAAAGWKVRSFHWEPHQTPDAKEWAKFDAAVKRTGAKWMLWEAEPTAETQAELDRRGVRWIVVRHVGAKPKEGDFVSVMRENYDSLIQLEPQTEPESATN